ncbi:hypothetical protein LNA76_05890 [Alcaligenes sp. MMA]|uniref:hypothetical protein n=1 Tax=Alcaligenes sp. MMA TaxID=2893019 RepID=UPI001E37FADE|nr:hypothetical protein [Alcaligenes sp. MMA]MCC9162856.1 hypothetical protein [Alcaligenes sp. MMA]
MSIRITTNNFEKTKQSIISKISAADGIDSWLIKRQAQLHHKSEQWGPLGYFKFFKRDGSENLYLILQQTEAGSSSKKWDTALGSLHGDMVQLLINHFPELSGFSPENNYKVNVSSSFAKYEPA